MGLVRAPGRPLRRCAVLALVAWTVVACTSSTSNSTKTKGSSVAGNTWTAIVYLEQARAMVAALAQAVVPGVAVKQTGSDGPPSKCEAPLTGLTYFSIFRDFDAPAGRTGASLLPAITAELKKQGFVTAAAEPGGAFTVVNAEKDKKVGVAAMGSPTSSLVRIGVSTRCGKPTAADDDVDMEPTPSAS
jgi:hypothetical protein